MSPDSHATSNDLFVYIDVVDASLHKASIESNNSQRATDAQSKHVVSIISKIIIFTTLDNFFAMTSSSLCERGEELANAKNWCRQGCLLSTTLLCSRTQSVRPRIVLPPSNESTERRLPPRSTATSARDGRELMILYCYIHNVPSYPKMRLCHICRVFGKGGPIV